jgi:hypothetical protein
VRSNKIIHTFATKHLCIQLKNSIKIRHQFIYPEQDGEECLMILLMLENNKVVMIGTAFLPVWHRFYDENYKYYPMCHN